MMIHEIYPQKYNPAYEVRDPNPEDFALFYKDNEVLLYKDKEELQIPSFRNFEGQMEAVMQNVEQYLFSIDDKAFYLITEISLKDTDKFIMQNISVFRLFQPLHMAFAGITGSQMQRWYENRKYCGRCGGLMEHSTKERAVFCPSCKSMEYPKISPAIIVAITDGDRLLMARNRYSTYKHFALIAGFVETGETLEETVEREVLEEVGLKVKNIRYYKSQPWSFSDSLMLGFFAELDGDDTITLQESELSEAKWFGREEIPLPPNNISIGQEMIERFRYGEI